MLSIPPTPSNLTPKKIVEMHATHHQSHKADSTGQHFQRPLKRVSSFPKSQNQGDEADIHQVKARQEKPIHGFGGLQVAPALN
jgi:hypothetical protein